MLKVIRVATYSAVLLSVLLVTLVATLAFYALEQEPLVRHSAPVDSAAVEAGKALLKRLNSMVNSADEGGITLVIAQGELRDLARMGAHTFSWFNADVDFDTTNIYLPVSLQLVPNPIGEYLNLGFQVEQSSEGIAIDRLSVGPLEVPGRWILPAVARLADVVLGNTHASQLLASIHGFHIEGDTAVFSVFPPPNVKAQLKQTVRKLQASRFSPQEAERVVHYYDLLAAMGESTGARRLSLSKFLSVLMAEAMRRETGSSAIEENRAAIWALSIYFSNGGFETLLGKLVSNQRNLAVAPAGVTLAGRADLMYHFVYSAGITLATQYGIGVAAGEFKELLDSGNGGSGFSFVDLAADRTGIAFVTVATASESSARRLQDDIVQNNNESAFFPDVSGLKEGLSEAQFYQWYESTESERYRKKVASIDQRISRLPIYP